MAKGDVVLECRPIDGDGGFNESSSSIKKTRFFIFYDSKSVKIITYLPYSCKLKIIQWTLQSNSHLILAIL